MQNSDDKLKDKYSFLDDRTKKETHIFELLEEISVYQKKALEDSQNKMATLESLENSRNIKIPFTPSRKKNIQYLLDILLRNHPEQCKKIISFNFSVNSASKKLDIIETLEFTVLLKSEDVYKIQEIRDNKSTASLENLLSQFRLFNLTKLIKKAYNKGYLSQLIKTNLLGKTIFTFKNHSLTKGNAIIAEDYCFHLKNYDAVKNKINILEIKKIISNHNTEIMRRLKSFGILNTEFNDYRDNKLDYIINILLKDIPSSLSKIELISVKNFDSIKKCLNKVNTVIDPTISINKDIVQYIQKNEICKEGEITAVFENIDHDLLQKWISNSATKNKIVTYNDSINGLILISSTVFFNKFNELKKLIIDEKEKFQQLEYEEQNKYLALMNLLSSIATSILSNKAEIEKIYSEKLIDDIGIILEGYKQFQKQYISSERKKIEKQLDEKSKSIFVKIIDAIKSFFKHDKSSQPKLVKNSAKPITKKEKKIISKDTRNLYAKIKDNTAPLIPLSEYIEIKAENEKQIDLVINELRNSNLKIIIPIYNSDKTLYPIRSQKFLIPDSEYLLVDPEIIESPELIRGFSDQLTGFKLKGETLTGVAIILIEKYLLTLHRQNKKTMRKN